MYIRQERLTLYIVGILRQSKSVNALLYYFYIQYMFVVSILDYLLMRLCVRYKNIIKNTFCFQKIENKILL